jgi:hypothetical protein
VTAGSGDDVLLGGPRRDELRGDGGADRVAGAAGRDQLWGSPGADALAGGAGVDSAIYQEREAPVSVTLDGRADDGEAGEGDDVGLDVENVIGGFGDDSLRGSAVANRLEGGEGDNDLDGGGGDDVLDDYLGDGGRLVGGPGRDRLVPGSNAEVMVRDGEADRVRCDGLARPLRADAIDTLRLCVPPLEILAFNARVTASGRVRVPVRCDAIDQPCRLRAEIRHGGETLARATLRLRPLRQTASLRLNARGRRLVQRHPRLDAILRTQLFRTRPAPSVSRRVDQPFTLERR